MATRMPSEMEEKLFNLNDPEQIMRLQKQWNAYVEANEKYELNYPQQLGNLVLYNRTMNLQKTIPTPAEQMEQYKQSILDEIQELENEKGIEDREEEYYLEESVDPDIEKPDPSKDFDTNWEDVAKNLKEYQLAEPEAVEQDNVKFEDLGLTWVNEYYEQQRAMGKEIQAEQEQGKEVTEAADKFAEFKLDFGLNMNDMEQEMEREMEDLDMEYE